MSSPPKQPTLGDLFAKLDSMSSDNKSEFGEIKKKIEEDKSHTNQQIQNISERLCTIDERNNALASEVSDLKNELQRAKQERLKNNVRISGIKLVADSNASDIVLQIFQALHLSINRSDYSAKITNGRAFIIVKFWNASHKFMLISAMRKKKSLLCEEVFARTQSNSKIYINDHLTDYYAALFSMAWTAKANHKLSFASSAGGHIRVKKHAESEVIFIKNEAQLKDIIELESAEVADSSATQTDRNMTASPHKSNKRNSSSEAAARTSKKTKQELHKNNHSIQKKEVHSSNRKDAQNTLLKEGRKKQRKDIAQANRINRSS